MKGEEKLPSSKSFNTAVEEGGQKTFLAVTVFDFLFHFLSFLFRKLHERLRR